MVFEHGSEYGSRWEAISSIAEKIGCASVDCFFVLGMVRLSSGSEDPAKCLLAYVTQMPDFF